MELKARSRAESGFPQGTLVPKLRPTALPFNNSCYSENAVLTIPSVSVLMVRAKLLDLYGKGVFVDSKPIENFAS
jgi:hypothetical protein